MFALAFSAEAESDPGQQPRVVTRDLTVTIHDAVDGTNYVLRPRDKMATRIGVSQEIGRAAAESARAHVEQLRKQGKLPATERREIIIRRFEGDDDRVRMHIAPGAALRIEAPEAIFSANGRDPSFRLGPIAGALGDMKWSRNASTKNLGTREIEGVKRRANCAATRFRPARWATAVALFAVPSDYTVKDVTAGATRVIEKKAS